MLSYWEQLSFCYYDHIIVGSGIVGLSMAIEIKERHPHRSVLVLERGLLPTGASTRNAGFACMGSATELLDDMTHMQEAEVVQLFTQRKHGLELLRKRLGDKGIGYAANGSYELIRKEEAHALDSVEALNKLLQPVLGQPAYKMANEKIDAFGFAREHVHAMIENTCEGELHTGKMMRALIDRALQHSVEIKTGAAVLRYEEEEKYVAVVLQDEARNEELVLHCDNLTLCTNAFTKQLLPDTDVVPGRGQVLITQPIPGLRFKGVFHFDKGYYYFREVDGRVLLGGGRNMDFNGEQTTDFALNEQIQIALEEQLHTMILPGTHYLVAQRWTGIMAFGANKYPIVKAFTSRVSGAFRMGGMGVALGSEVARQLADIIDEQ